MAAARILGVGRPRPDPTRSDEQQESDCWFQDVTTIARSAVARKRGLLAPGTFSGRAFLSVASFFFGERVRANERIVEPVRESRFKLVDVHLDLVRASNGLPIGCDSTPMSLRRDRLQRHVRQRQGSRR
jgi:hypothetical protein